MKWLIALCLALLCLAPQAQAQRFHGGSYGGGFRSFAPTYRYSNGGFRSFAPNYLYYATRDFVPGCPTAAADYAPGYVPAPACDTPSYGPAFVPAPYYAPQTYYYAAPYYGRSFRGGFYGGFRGRR